MGTPSETGISKKVYEQLWVYSDTGVQISTEQQGDFGNNIRGYIRGVICLCLSYFPLKK